MADGRKQKNIQIPFDVFENIVNLLYCLGDCQDLQDAKLAALYEKVDAGIRKKRVTMLHRDNYAKFMHSNDDASKKAALDNYVATKQYYAKHH